MRSNKYPGAIIAAPGFHFEDAGIKTEVRMKRYDISYVLEG
ncbi:hypothetical protein MNBD_ALPHA04-1068 [hydrothermal vent metagenome]|uniref:Uncharacterized protein n=1 Tax=hydrothermal vent metagenome TaxID=652676 RepID=A0A3B0R4A3_9ZZZZ